MGGCGLGFYWFFMCLYLRVPFYNALEPLRSQITSDINGRGKKGFNSLIFRLGECLVSLQHRTWTIIRVQNEIKMGIFPVELDRRRGKHLLVVECENEMKLLKIVKSCGSMAFVGM